MQLTGVIRTDQSLLLTTLAASRQICDEQLLLDAVERVAVALAEGDDAKAAIALVARASETFARRPGWVLEAHLNVVAALPEGDDRTALWNSAAAAARRLPNAYGRVWFLAALAPVAPAQSRIEYTLAAWAAIQRLELPFERAYAAIRLLPALDDDSRKVKLEWVITQLSQYMSRPERFRVVRGLMSRLNDADLATYRPTLEANIDRVLLRTPVTDAEPGREDKLNADEVGIYFDELVPFFDLARTREAVARCPSSAVSSLELLALRLAELHQRDEALDAIRRLESPGDRAGALARMLSHAPAAEGAAILGEACKNLEESVEEEPTAEAEAFLVEYLAGVEREQRIAAALERAHSIRHSRTRHDTFHRLATSAAANLSPDQLDAIWAEQIRRIASKRREEVVADFVALLPIVSRLTGNGGLRTLGDTLLDVAEWFP
jgi:hypothetical protein